MTPADRRPRVRAGLYGSGPRSVGGRRSAVAGRCRPPLTTIRQPLSRISREMVRLLLAMIDGDSPAGMILPTALVERGSA